MKILCKSCNKQVVLSQQQLEFIRESKEKKMSLLMLECPLCHHSFPYNLHEQANNSLEYRCPIKACSGHVSFIDDEFWGCGECGNIWSNLADLFKSIQEIINIYPYRKKVYLISGSKFTPIQKNQEPQNYEEIVKNEWD